MTDNELIERLRRNLQERAGSIHPSPAQVPTMNVDPSAGPGALSSQPTVLPGGAAYEERQTPEYQLTPPTGPVPIVGRIGKAVRRGPVLTGIGAIAAAAAIVAAVVTLSSQGHPVKTGPTGQGAPATTQAPATSVPAPSPSTPSSVVTTPPVVPVPNGFQPLSVTFVSTDDGWVLGKTATQVVLAATTDGGVTWQEVNAPPLPNVVNFPPFNVRFADRNDGWIYTAADSGQPTQLWSTHDGGLTWRPVAVPLTGGTIGDLEAAGGQASMVVYGACPAGTSGCQGQFEAEVLTSPTKLDEWVPSPVQPSVGAGPVFSSALTLWGSDGWLVDNNRTVVSGARLTRTSGWTAWTPACSRAGGAGLVAASSATDLTALCAEGVWGTPDPGTTAGHSWLFRSTDGGATFTSVGPVPPSDNPQSLTVAPGNGETIVLADSQIGLQASFDGGHTWKTVEPGLTNSTAANPGGWFGFVGFTSATQGVAIEYKPTPTLFMTRDGGHTWSPVSF